MTSITIRRLDEGLKAKLRVQAAIHGRSMEEEARDILRMGVAEKKEPRSGLGKSIRRHLAGVGGVELSIPKRRAVRRPPELSK